jgi:hypothetical protein
MVALPADWWRVVRTPGIIRSQHGRTDRAGEARRPANRPKLLVEPGRSRRRQVLPEVFPAQPGSVALHLTRPHQEERRSEIPLTSSSHPASSEHPTTEPSQPPHHSAPDGRAVVVTPLGHPDLAVGIEALPGILRHRHQHFDEAARVRLIAQPLQLVLSDPATTPLSRIRRAVFKPAITDTVPVLIDTTAQRHRDQRPSKTLKHPTLSGFTAWLYPTPACQVYFRPGCDPDIVQSQGRRSSCR